MEDNNREPSAGYVFESAMEHMHRIHRLDVIIIIILSILLAAEGIIFMIMWNQYDYEDETCDVDIEASQDGEGINIVGAGDIDYGANSTSESNEKDSEENP